MKRVLLTGMSGTGKSTTIAALAARGYRAVDLDEHGYSVRAPDGDWVWHEERVAELLADGADDQAGEVLFVSGCAENQRKFRDRFDRIILLSAPTDVIVERLRTRTTNTYGKHPDELADTLYYIETVEPRLRRTADHEVDTTAPLDDVVETVLRLVAS